MTEHDVFESRLRTALVRHVADGPTDFDALAFARTVAAKEPRRRGLAAALAWRGSAVPRRAWVLLLLAGLLAAMVAGTLLVGSQLQRKLSVVVPPVAPSMAPSIAPSIAPAFVCPAGTNPDMPGPVDQARPVIGDGIASMVFDRHAGKVVLLAQLLERVETWTFDVCTNTWTRMHPDREPSSSGSKLVYDVDSDVTILIEARQVWAYDLKVDTWTSKDSVAPIDASSSTLATSWAYDPVTGLVVAAAAEFAASPEWKKSRPELSSYDVATDTWTPIRQDGPAPAWGRGASFSYDASADRLIAYGVNGSPDAGNETWLLDLRTGTWSKAGADTPNIQTTWGMAPFPPVMVYDEAAERTVVRGDGRLATYDATADRWEYLLDAVGTVPFDAYDAVNERFIGLGENGDSVLAYDLATREQIVLLEPTATQPAPGSR
jgi:hypothetical protein